MESNSKIDANNPEEEIQLQTHLESSSSSQMMINNGGGGAERDLKVKKNSLPGRIEDQQQVRFLFHVIVVMLIAMMETVSAFVNAYRKGCSYSSPMICLGLQQIVPIHILLRIYRSMPPEKKKSSAGLRLRFIIWSLFTVLALILVFLCSDLLNWNFGSTVAVDVVVFVLSVFLLATGRFEHCVLRRDEIDVTANPAIVAGK